MPTIQNTTEQLTTPEIQTRSPWSDANAIVDGFKSEPGFIAQLMRLDASHSDPTTREYADVLSAYSKSFVNAHEGDQIISPDLAEQITLIASAPLYIGTQIDLAYYDGERKRRRFPKDEWRHYQSLKDSAIEFNQQTSSYAYGHPDDKLSDVNKALTGSALASYPRHAEMVEKHITDTTRGARTEAVTRQLLDVAGIPYTPGTAEDDRKGGDVIVHYRGNNIKIDIKSSLDDIAYVRGGYDEIKEQNLTYAIHKRPNEKVSDHVIKLYPGIVDKDIGDALGIKLDSDFATSRSQFIAIQLQKAIHELGF